MSFHPAGLSEFYVPFMLSLHKYCETTQITAVTHLGLGSSSPGVYTLAEQTEHKLAFVRQQMAVAGCSDFVLIGHSIGWSSHSALATVPHAPHEEFAKLQSACCRSVHGAGGC